MVIDWVSIIMAVAGGLATLWMRRRNPPVPTPPPGPTPGPEPAPVPPSSGRPILDALLAILNNLAAQRPVAGLEATVVTDDGGRVRVHVAQEPANEPA